MDSQVSIIIVSWNKKEFVLDCLKSLETQTFKDFETILVDNGSTDGLSEAVEKEYSKVKIVRLKENLGFVGGNNEGYKHSKGKYIVWMDCDLTMPPSLVPKMISLLKDYDVVVGSRYVEGGGDKRSFVRVFTIIKSYILSKKTISNSAYLPL